MKMNNERFEIIIKDLGKDTIVLKEKTNTVMGAVNKGKGSQCFSMHQGTNKPLLEVMLALTKFKENTLEQMADRLTDSVLNKLFGGENE